MNTVSDIPKTHLAWLICSRSLCRPVPWNIPYPGWTGHSVCPFLLWSLSVQQYVVFDWLRRQQLSILEPDWSDTPVEGEPGDTCNVETISDARSMDHLPAASSLILLRNRSIACYLPDLEIQHSSGHMVEIQSELLCYFANLLSDYWWKDAQTD